MLTTFEAVVGRGDLQQQFTLHTEPFTKRSEFFRAARSPHWLTDPTNLVDCEDDDPEIFSAYVNFVYFGADGIKAEVEDETSPDSATGDFKQPDSNGDLGLPDFTAAGVDQQNAVEHQGTGAWSEKPCKRHYEGENGESIAADAFTWSENECKKRYESETEEPSLHKPACHDHLFHLAQMYLQADKLQDLTTANAIMDEFLRFTAIEGYFVGQDLINLVYKSTVHGNPFRRLLRDCHLHSDTETTYLIGHHMDVIPEFYRDVYVEFVRLKQWAKPTGVHHVFFVTIWHKAAFDKCQYHRHDCTSNLRCVPPPPRPLEMEDPETTGW
jgi:hypothetical protein